MQWSTLKNVVCCLTAEGMMPPTSSWIVHKPFSLSAPGPKPPHSSLEGCSSCCYFVASLGCFLFVCFLGFICTWVSVFGSLCICWFCWITRAISRDFGNGNYWTFCLKYKKICICDRGNWRKWLDLCFGISCCSYFKYFSTEHHQWNRPSAWPYHHLACILPVFFWPDSRTL